ncbi:uncharacterized protein LDX57_000454 [Aspergillus melleus]|uniref:uncharacterized protein n=1 Tax=Aspergillus melleus TaxID=138277 RepID=UPI001E8E0FD5|nr:uncharacterized protein LDX57_000454 [Aspergillus melleus]KAH8422700.1 hypothetical protein LDX57_000454 [Aspergillus melleus]
MAWRLGFYRGGRVFISPVSGIDIALWDLKGWRLGVPIHQLLGGKARHKLSVYAWIGGDRPSDVEAAGKEHLPRVLESSVERLKTIKALGLNAARDFHGRLHKPMAKQLDKALEPHRPLSLEEPLLSDLVSCPIALGERLCSRWDVKRFLGDASVDVLQPDFSNCGGVSEFHRIAAMAETYDVALASHCPLGHIALAVCMQVDLATPNFAIHEMSLGIHYNKEAGEYDTTSYVKGLSVFDVKDGYVDALTRPGLGIEIDEDVVRRLARSTEPWQPKELSSDRMVASGKDS